jgi:hypothetical protein
VTAIDFSPQVQPWRLAVKSGLLTAANFRGVNFRSLGIWPDLRGAASQVAPPPILFWRLAVERKARRVESAGLGWDLAVRLTSSAIDQRVPRIH